MKIKQHLSTGVAAASLLCLGMANLQAAGHTYHLANLASGNWNDLNQRQANSYQIGFSTGRPHIQAAYFEFDLTPAKGKTVTDCNLLIAGSTDYHISSVFSYLTPPKQFKVGIAAQSPLANPFSVSQITTGNNIASIYHYCALAAQNPDLGYRKVTDGLHLGVTFDAFHFDSAHRIQAAVNAGGNYVLWARDDFDGGNDGQNYIWGSTVFNAGNILNITTSD